MVKYTAQNPFERFPDGRPKVPDALLEKVKGLSAEEVLGIAGRGSRTSSWTACRCSTRGKNWSAGP